MIIVSEGPVKGEKKKKTFLTETLVARPFLSEFSYIEKQARENQNVPELVGGGSKGSLKVNWGILGKNTTLNLVCLGVALCFNESCAGKSDGQKLKPKNRIPDSPEGRGGGSGGGGGVKPPKKLLRVDKKEKRGGGKKSVSLKTRYGQTAGYGKTYTMPSRKKVEGSVRQRLFVNPAKRGKEGYRKRSREGGVSRKGGLGQKDKNSNIPRKRAKQHISTRENGFRGGEG